MTPGTWSEHTFGKANLGDPRRTQRLIAMASAACERPGGTVTGTMRNPAEREGAFRFLESDKISSTAVAEAVFETTAGDCSELDGFVFVAMDRKRSDFRRPPANPRLRTR
jgi:hypothetical protein